MKKLTLIFTLVFSTVMFSSPSYAEWIPFGYTLKGDMMYLNPKGIFEKSGRNYFFAMRSTKLPSLQDPEMSPSSLILFQADCKGFRNKAI